MAVTNHIKKDTSGNFIFTTEQVIKPYREKVIIESAFRDIKSFVEIAPVYVWTINHVKAHYTCCVLSYLINRTLTKLLHEQRGVETDGIITHESLYQKLSECKITSLKVQGHELTSFSITQVTKEQKELLTRVGLNDLLKVDVVAEARKTIMT